MAALFFADNRDVLVPARRFHRAKKQGIAEDAGRTDDRAPATEDIEEVFSGSVTLLEPPPGTPETNQDLSERNAPRLRAAIAQWEQVSGHAFEWSRGFRQHGYP